MASKSSKHDASGSESDNILVGSVIRPHALRGEVRIQIHSDVPDRFRPGRELLLRQSGQQPERVTISSFRAVRDGAVIGFEGWGDRNLAETLRGAQLEVTPAEVPAAPEGLYYHFELVGCTCVDVELGELGVVTAVLEDGGGELLELDCRGRKAVGPGRNRLLIPFVEAFLEEVDTAGRVIRCRLPAGLIDTCASRS
ncbi:MAG: ribosome maturation factor RimM [Acidobacteriota bacterium]